MGPPKAENKGYSEPDFKTIDNPYKREKFSPRNIRFVPGLICQYDPAIIERTIGLVLGPFTALYRSFLKRCTLTNKAVGTI